MHQQDLWEMSAHKVLWWVGVGFLWSLQVSVRKELSSRVGLSSWLAAMSSPSLPCYCSIHLRWVWGILLKTLILQKFFCRCSWGILCSLFFKIRWVLTLIKHSIQLTVYTFSSYNGLYTIFPSSSSYWEYFGLSATFLSRVTKLRIFAHEGMWGKGVCWRQCIFVGYVGERFLLSLITGNIQACSVPFGLVEASSLCTCCMCWPHEAFYRSAPAYKLVFADVFKTFPFVLFIVFPIPLLFASYSFFSLFSFFLLL